MPGTGSSVLFWHEAYGLVYTKDTCNWKKIEKWASASDKSHQVWAIYVGVGPGFSKEGSKLRPDRRKGASRTGKVSGSFTRGEGSLYKGRGVLVNMASLGTEYQRGVEGLCSSLDVGQSFPDALYFLLISRTVMQGRGVVGFFLLERHSCCEREWLEGFH